ncbi:phospholipid phosphatase 5-like [Pectinophora gossypiella]|uniref:phospholipid phosphatase 5-like n=1 Tax=Pectinophora gossypiella TaxID=13191 RepID=UPI00214F01E7|nr:phospholipid phosphatase 5-like [Pectinophora gossypiella]
MWPGIRNLRTSIDSTELFTELIVRVILLLVAVVMQLTVSPHMHHISEVDLLNNYKRPRHQSYVPPWATILIVIIIPLILIGVPLYLTKNYVDLTQSFLAWTLALSINAVITETIKLMTGRPRPDYFYRCFPDGEMTKELVCTGDLKDILEGRKSFPSGHSSFSFCSMGFLSFWLCGKLGVLSGEESNAIHVVTCVSPLVAAAAVAISRCCDNHHHWEDVLVGSLLGLVSSYLCYNQYFYPLDSEYSGYTYAMTSNRMTNISSQTKSCTNQLSLCS